LSHSAVPRHCVGRWNAEGSYHRPSYDGHTEMNGHEIHPISEVTVRSGTFMCIGIHSAEYKRICYLFVFIRRSKRRTGARVF